MNMNAKAQPVESGFMQTADKLPWTHYGSLVFEKIEGLAQNNPNPVLRIDSSGELLFANQAALHLASSMEFLSPFDLLGLRDYEWVEKRPSLDQSWIHETTFHNGQTYRWYLVHEKQDESFACYGFETSDLRHCEIALIESQRMEWIGQTAATIAHDFNNYLGSIIMAIEGAERAEKAGKPHGRFLEIAKNTAHQATQLSRRLSDFGKTSDRKTEKIRLDAFFESRRDLFVNCLGKAITFNVDVSSRQKDASINFDPALLEQTLMNLLVNARHAIEDNSPKKGIVTITHELSPDGKPRLIIEDNGIGMDEKTRSRIFDPYFTTKKSGRGSGLGMFAVITILKESGGAIAVQSEPGIGTRFTLEFA